MKVESERGPPVAKRFRSLAYGIESVQISHIRWMPFNVFLGFGFLLVYNVESLSVFFRPAMEMVYTRICTLYFIYY